MKICPKCNTEVQDSSKFCPKCGENLTNVPPAEKVNQNLNQTTPGMQTITFMTSLWCFIFRSLCGTIQIERNSISFSTPNTVLSIVPFGKRNETVPIDQIASVESNFELSLKELIIGIIIALVGLDCLESSFLLGLILTAVGASMIINAFQCVLTICTTSGDYKCVFFLIFEKDKLEPAEKYINQLISNRLNETNQREQTDRLIDAINNK